MEKSTDFSIDFRVGKGMYSDLQIQENSIGYRNLSLTDNNSTRIVGRDEELDCMCHRLLCRLKPNLLLVGDPGVGKTSLVEGLAVIAKNSPHPKINRLQFFEINCGELISGTSFRGDFEKKLMSLVKEFKNSESSVIFIDEAHTLAMTGNIEGGIDALNLLKPFLTNGQLKCILATTPAEVSLLSKDKAFMRRFSVLRLNHLNLEQQSQAIRIKGKDLFDFHGVKPFLEIFSFVDDFFLRKKIGLDLALDFIDEVLSELSINKFKKLDDTFLQKRFKKFKKMRDLSIDRRKF